MVAWNYSSTATEGTLTAGVDSSAGTLHISGMSGLPTATPYTLVLDPDTASEEIVTVTARSGTQFTVTRGQDGTVALPHQSGARVRHKMTARDLRWSREHEEAGSGVHGRSSALVGVSDTQTLTNKSLNGNNNSFSNIPQAAVTGLPALQEVVNRQSRAGTIGVRIRSKNTGSYGSSGSFTLLTNWNTEVHPSAESGSGIAYGSVENGALSVGTSAGLGAGIYQAFCQIGGLTTNSNAVGSFRLRLMLNNSITLAEGTGRKDVPGNYRTTADAYANGIYMEPGDYVQAFINNNLGSTFNFSEVAGVNRFGLVLVRTLA